MLVNKSLTVKGVLNAAGFHFVWLTLWMALVTLTYHFTHWKWMAIPWLPLSVIGTAVAFYVGFKNNQAYDRLWEGRKIWGGIVNGSRTWGTMVRAFVGNNGLGEAENKEIQERLIYRHIAWTYTLREQLLVPTQWEHVSLRKQFGKINRERKEKYGVGAFTEEEQSVELDKYLRKAAFNSNIKHANTAAYLIDAQAQDLAKLAANGHLDIFKQLELQRVLNDFYDNQGKTERIKKFPLPRQYGSFSFIFVCIIIILLPFGIVGEFSKMGDIGIWLSVPFGALVGWVYVVMELIGDYSENPFEGLVYDIPMLTICRNIEIELLQQMGVTNLPAPIQAKRGILM